MEVWDDRQIRAGSEKTWEAIYRGLEQHQGAGFYFAVPHKEVAVGGGIYMPMPETLRGFHARLQPPMNADERQ